ncbi:hypothetical protein BOTBODRAFT_176918 [Botryobasidium botryosum FD-172 SS1]|uniref:Uncharacterized protein n=1 Tax=Botryobasidium botryosum (strain FD-172 SS1) TaxID=930990 RepID=A0A067M8Q0_BOTB1|nr:hypothetical protein BOTBODRAFT_176918 [Botryobasidium botryosum FD-172 SS1]
MRRLYVEKHAHLANIDPRLRGQTSNGRPSGSSNPVPAPRADSSRSPALTPPPVSLTENERRITSLENRIEELQRQVEARVASLGDNTTGNTTGAQKSRRSLKRKRVEDKPPCTGDKKPAEWNYAESQLAKRLSNAIGETMRDLMGVPKGSEKWPDPLKPGDEPRRNKDTDFVYLTPAFNREVTDPVNESIIARTIQLVEKEENDAANLHNTPERPPFSTEWLRRMTVVKFQGWRTQWKAQDDEDARARLAKNEHTTHMQNRRVQKLAIRAEGAILFQVEYGIDPSDLLEEECMSDEIGTAPDNDPDWKENLIDSCPGFREKIKDINSFECLEVITPAWRSERLTDLLHWLDHLYWENKAASHKKKRGRARKVRIDNHKVHLAPPPSYIPYDFAINASWLANFGRRDFPDETRDWMTRGNIQDFGDSYNAPYCRDDKGVLKKRV